MIAALVQGTLFRAPEQRTAKSGKPFVTATLRVKDGETSQFVRLVAFVQPEFMRLSDGDAVSVQGALKVELYTTESGETKISLRIVADQILPLKQPPNKHEVKTAAPPDARSKAERHFRS
jgi:single-stranded DNA-binding protein